MKCRICRERAKRIQITALPDKSLYRKAMQLSLAGRICTRKLSYDSYYRKTSYSTTTPSPHHPTGNKDPSSCPPKVWARRILFLVQPRSMSHRLLPPLPQLSESHQPTLSGCRSTRPSLPGCWPISRRCMRIVGCPTRSRASPGVWSRHWLGCRR